MPCITHWWQWVGSTAFELLVSLLISSHHVDLPASKWSWPTLLYTSLSNMNMRRGKRVGRIMSWSRVWHWRSLGPLFQLNHFSPVSSCLIFSPDSFSACFQTYVILGFSKKYENRLSCSGKFTKPVISFSGRIDWLPFHIIKWGHAQRECLSEMDSSPTHRFHFLAPFHIKWEDNSLLSSYFWILYKNIKKVSITFLFHIPSLYLMWCVCVCVFMWHETRRQFHRRKLIN